VLAGLPESTIAPLQRVLNAAARLVLRLRPRDHVTAALIDLHWLPVAARIEFKLCTLVYQSITGSGNAPTYINDERLLFWWPVAVLRYYHFIVLLYLLHSWQIN